MNDVANLLEKAADLYESEKIDWCQGGFFNQKSGEYMFGPNRIVSACAWGALLLAGVDEDVEAAWRLTSGVDPRDSRWSLIDRARVQLEVAANHTRPVAPNDYTLPGFNDMPGRTKQEIIDLMKGTAKELRNHV